MNATQFESIDLNQDGRADMVAFDRTTEQRAVFVNQPSGFVFDPLLTSQLPKFSHWMRFVDYDNDGLKDLFCAAPAGIQVFRNTSTRGTLSFESIANPFFSNEKASHGSCLNSMIRLGLKVFILFCNKTIVNSRGFV
jgi:hypothetical protein